MEFTISLIRLNQTPNIEQFQFLEHSQETKILYIRLESKAASHRPSFCDILEKTNPDVWHR